MMGVIEPEQTPAPISMEQEQALAAESEAAPREEEVIPEGTAEAVTGVIVLEEGPALTNESAHERDAVRETLVRRRPRGPAAHLDVEYKLGHGLQQPLRGSERI
jgi:hypothetical protein